jgi:transcriptional regulator with XRE-family HTH domain
MNNLKNLRKIRNLSQNEVASKMGVTQATVSHWERSGKVPKEHHVRLGEIFGVEPDSFRTPEEDVFDVLLQIQNDFQSLEKQTQEIGLRLVKARVLQKKVMRRTQAKDAA